METALAWTAQIQLFFFFFQNWPRPLSYLVLDWWSGEKSCPISSMTAWGRVVEMVPLSLMMNPAEVPASLIYHLGNIIDKNWNRQPDSEQQSTALLGVQINRSTTLMFKLFTSRWDLKNTMVLEDCNSRGGEKSQTVRMYRGLWTRRIQYFLHVLL